MSWVRSLGLDVRDALAFAGAGALLYGVSCWSGPAAWVLGGMLLLGLALWPDLRKSRAGR